MNLPWNTLRPLLAGIVLALTLSACGGGATVGGTLSGLNSGVSVMLQNNGSDSLTLTSNGSFAFASSVNSGDSYSVTVLTQPIGQTCVVGNASGTIGLFGNDVNGVTVTCANSLSVSGTVSGLAAGTSVTLSNAGVQVAVAVNGPFAFPGTLVDGSTYDVTVAVQPVGRVCTVANATGTIVAGVATNVVVTCV